MAERSVVCDVGPQTGECGYCHSGAHTSVAHGMLADVLTPADYQDLIDLGWRRSGTYIYKPDLTKSCCPAYTIRTWALDFRPNRDQARLLRKLAALLAGTPQQKGSDGGAPPPVQTKGAAGRQQAATAVAPVEAALRQALRQLQSAGLLPAASYSEPTLQPRAAGHAVGRKRGNGACDQRAPGALLLASPCAFPIVALARRVAPATHGGLTPAAVAAALSDAMRRDTSTAADWQVTAADGYVNIDVPVPEGGLQPAQQALQAAEQTQTPPIPTTSPAPPASTSSRLEVRLVPSTFIEAEFQLYKRYQVAQHGDAPDEVTREGYTRFLVDSPLPPAPHAAAGPAVTPQHASDLAVRQPDATSDNGAAAEEEEAGIAVPPSCGYGSFHMQYWLDGALVAVGVVDVLPRCLSSVYVFWEPSARSLALGKLSALYELLWVRQAFSERPGTSLQWYYMGFYIHSCHKMQYKAAYRPGDLLCPRTRAWVRATSQVLAALDVPGSEEALCISHVPGARVFHNWADASPSEQTQVPQQHTDAVMVRLWDRVWTWQTLKRYVSDEGVRQLQSALEAWVRLVGCLAPRLVYALDGPKS